MKKTNSRRFYYRRELSKGSIPNDKIKVGDEPYETSWWNEIIGTKLENKFLKLKFNDIKELNFLFDEIDKKIETFFEKKNIELENSDIRPFYLNFNYDGVDCFVHRWNLKYKK